ncbi:hypothetical protein ACWGPD_10445 [Streptomyces hirsutus]|uniref:hypothetical protein n=1 Tax=Streptomyces hirsutus TaxID=35620 RepID=UPI0036297420
MLFAVSMTFTDQAVVAIATPGETVRNYAAGVGPVVLGTMLTHATTDNAVNTLESRGVPPGEARGVARQVTEAVSGGGDTRVPEGGGEAGAAMRDAMQAVLMDFAQADRWVFYGMAVALGIAFPVALRHPGGRAAWPRPRRTNGAPGPRHPDPTRPPCHTGLALSRGRRKAPV